MFGTPSTFNGTTTYNYLCQTEVYGLNSTYYDTADCITPEGDTVRAHACTNVVYLWSVRMCSTRAVHVTYTT